MIRVLYAPAAGPAAVIETDGTLKAMQALVGGYLEGVRLADGLYLHCNEDGMHLGLRRNQTFPRFLGDVFVARVDAEGEMASVTETDIMAAGLMVGAPGWKGAP